MAQTANVCVSMIPVISGRQDVLQSAVLRDVVRQSVDHAPKTHNKITLRKEVRKRERMSLAGTRHAAGHKRQRAFPRVCSSAEGLKVPCVVIQKERANAMLHLHTAKKSCRIYACLMCSHHEPHRTRCSSRKRTQAPDGGKVVISGQLRGARLGWLIKLYCITVMWLFSGEKKVFSESLPHNPAAVSHGRCHQAVETAVVQKRRLCVV